MAKPNKLSSVQFSSVIQSCPTLCDPMDCRPQAPLSMGFPRQEYWSGLPFLSPGDLPHPGIEPRSPALAGGFFTTEPPRAAHRHIGRQLQVWLELPWITA